MNQSQIVQSQIVIVASGFPRRSETFLLNELLALESRGLLAAIFATKPGDCNPVHPQCMPILRRVQYLCLGTPEEQAADLVSQLNGKVVTGIHGYFAHIPAEVASLAAKSIGVPYGFSTHALDARKVTSAALGKRAAGAACVVACNHDVSKVLAKSYGNFNVIPHGVDTQRFYPTALPQNNPVRLMAVGRLVEKKGFDVLIRAVSRLSFPFQLKIVGEGVEHQRLSAMIADENLSNRVDLCGPMTHSELPEAYRQSDIIIVPSIINKEGDRDGLPNVLLEAMASGRPVIASDVGAIGTAITDQESGLLLPSGDVRALAMAIASLTGDRRGQKKLALVARRRVEDDFELGACSEHLCNFLEAVYSQRLYASKIA